MINNKNKLEIFENFEIDYNLPKFSKIAENVELSGSIAANLILNVSDQSSGSWGNVTVPTNNFGVWSGESSVLFNTNAEPFFPQKEGWFKKTLNKFKKKKEERKKTFTILNFFSSLAQSLNDLPVLQDIAIHYESAIANATKAGQTALVDRLKSRLDSVKTEVQLVTVGLNKYLTEEQIVDFYKQTGKDNKLKMTWIKHFVKPIPSKILDIKLNLDKEFVFDNYVILHYDPKNDATDLTSFEKKEIEKREKDPILFGVIKDSRRLYYVGDWIDDYCNLTLDVLLETLRENVNVVNNEKVKTYLDTGIRTEERIKWPEKNNFYTGYTVTDKTVYEEQIFIDELKKAPLKETKKFIKDFGRKGMAVLKKAKPKKKNGK